MTLRVCVVGLWHLGCTIAACLAQAGFRVVGLDPKPDVIVGLRQARLPVDEPGLADLIRSGLQGGALSFETDPGAALAEADVVWIAFDTPVDEQDEGDVAWVRRQAEDLIPWLAEGATVLVSSQVPIGFTRGLREQWARGERSVGLRFAYSPENLRLGKAIESFQRPTRVVVGTDDGAPHETLRRLFAPFSDNVLWMSLESAEMAKHSLNAFLATSVSFINEVARLCERYGADAKDVERALKSDPRIGPGAYLSPGPAFAGGTLARDIRFLSRLGADGGIPTPLLSAVLESNAGHTRWLWDKIQEVVGDLNQVRVGVLGLVYKAGTDTLRRSSALELCQWLAERGALVKVHDPAVRALPSGSHPAIERVASPAEVLVGAEVAVVATAWPEFRALSPDAVVAAMKTPRIIDPWRFLADILGADARIQYLAVGTPLRRQERARRPGA